MQAYYVTRLTAVPSLIRALLPSLQSSRGRSVRNFLRVFVLSGETFPIWLWELLHETLPDTAILNLYGTTEVSRLLSTIDVQEPYYKNISYIHQAFSTYHASILG